MRSISSFNKYESLVGLLKKILIVSTWKDFQQFIMDNVGTDVAAALDLPGDETPKMIAAWIFMKCDNCYDLTSIYEVFCSLENNCIFMED